VRERVWSNEAVMRLRFRGRCLGQDDKVDVEFGGADDQSGVLKERQVDKKIKKKPLRNGTTLNHGDVDREEAKPRIRGLFCVVFSFRFFFFFGATRAV